jgi:hypothetical protein
MIVASFSTEASLLRAAARLRSAGVRNVETYTPSEPLEDPDAWRSRIPLAVLIAGVLGAVGMFLLQTYATTIDYPLDIGGRPNFSWPAYIPNAFEVGVLFAILTGFIGFLTASRMPRLYERIDDCELFGNGGYCLAIDHAEPARTRALLAELDPIAVEELTG